MVISLLLFTPLFLRYDRHVDGGDPVAPAAEESNGAIVLSGDSGCSAIVTLDLTAAEFPNHDIYLHNGDKDPPDTTADGILDSYADVDVDADADVALHEAPSPSHADVAAGDASHVVNGGGGGGMSGGSLWHVDIHGQRSCDVDQAADDLVRDNGNDCNGRDVGVGGDSVGKDGNRDYNCLDCGCDVCGCAADPQDSDGEVEEIAMPDDDFGYYYDHAFSPEEMSGFATGDELFAQNDPAAQEQGPPNPASIHQHPPRSPVTENIVSAVVEANRTHHRRHESPSPLPREKLTKSKSISTSAATAAAAAEPTNSRERDPVPPYNYFGRVAAGRPPLTQGALALAKPSRYDDNIEATSTSSLRTAGFARGRSQPVGGGSGELRLYTLAPARGGVNRVQQGEVGMSRGGGRDGSGKGEGAGEEGGGTPGVERMPAYEEMTVQELASMVSVYGLKKKSKR